MEELTATVDCPDCEEPFEGVWVVASPEDAEEIPPAHFTCPSCKRINEYAYPGWTYFTEAG